jgi:hypothetical protein
MAWTTDQESLHRHVEDDEALLRLYTAEARRQARGDWRVYQRLHACHRCMVDYNTQALANDKVHDPATLRALLQGVGMTGRCAIMWMFYDPQDHSTQQPMLGSGPLSASLHECRAALIDTMLSTPSGGEAGSCRASVSTWRGRSAPMLSASPPRCSIRMLPASHSASSAPAPRPPGRAKIPACGRRR